MTHRISVEVLSMSAAKQQPALVRELMFQTDPEIDHAIDLPTGTGTIEGTITKIRHNGETGKATVIVSVSDTTYQALSASGVWAVKAK